MTEGPPHAIFEVQSLRQAAERPCRLEPLCLGPLQAHRFARHFRKMTFTVALIGNFMGIRLRHPARARGARTVRRGYSELCGMRARRERESCAPEPEDMRRDSLLESSSGGSSGSLEIVKLLRKRDWLVANEGRADAERALECYARETCERRDSEREPVSKLCQLSGVDKDASSARRASSSPSRFGSRSPERASRPSAPASLREDARKCAFRSRRAVVAPLEKNRVLRIP